MVGGWWGGLLVLGSFWLTFLLVGGVLVRILGVLFSFSNNRFKMFVLVGTSGASMVLLFWLWGVWGVDGFLGNTWSECSIFWSERGLPFTRLCSCLSGCGGCGGDVGYVAGRGGGDDATLRHRLGWALEVVGRALPHSGACTCSAGGVGVEVVVVAGIWYCWGGGSVATLRQRLGCVLVVVGWALPHSGTLSCRVTGLGGGVIPSSGRGGVTATCWQWPY